MSRTRTSQRRAPARKKRRGGLLRKLFSFGLFVAFCGALAAGGLFLWMSRDLPRFDKLVDYQPREATRVYAADGTQVATFHEELRTVVPPEEIPEVLKRAILAAEDAEFYQHEGLDYQGIARAFIKNVLSGESRKVFTTCCVIVEAPCFFLPAIVFLTKARAMPT